MEITEVRIKLVTNPSERLRAFCSITLNSDFVIRDLKIIEGVNGAFVAMPSRKLADRCPRCGCKNHLRAKFCNDCGVHLKENRAPKDGQGRAKLHADIAHPINAACRERIQKAVVDAYLAEVERSKLPGYKPQSFDDFDEYDSDMSEHEETVAEPSPVAQAQFTEYNSLIADLKRDAADRRSNVVPSETPKTIKLPESDGENAIGKPAYKRAADRPADRDNAEPGRKPAGMTTPTRASASDDDGFGAGLL
jgi:stage V sporulation protein G